MVLLRRFNQTVDGGAALRATRRVGEQPVLSAHASFQKRSGSRGEVCEKEVQRQILCFRC